jgi:hypothetical protein
MIRAVRVNHPVGSGSAGQTSSHGGDDGSAGGILMQDSPSLRGSLRKPGNAPPRRKHPWELEAEDLVLGGVVGAGSNGQVTALQGATECQHVLARVCVCV